MNDQSQPPSRDPRVDEIVAAYLDNEEQGRTPDRSALLAKYPELAIQLTAFFSDHDALRRMAGISQTTPAETEMTTLGLHLSLTPGTPVRYFGDYEIIEEIARGGMGVVYRARQISLNRVVALKMILAGTLASPSDVERFRREAEAAANLDHPHIVPIYEIGDLQGQHYFSMKLVDGGSLAQVMELGEWPAPTNKNHERNAAELIAIVARAVHHAHQRGILHRDLKPGNIIVDKQGVPYITDFGLALRVENDLRHTRTGSVLGTPSYMSPEQARSEKLLTTATDVYSLGAVLYELLTGKPPFKAATILDTLLLVLEQEPIPLQRLNPRVDADLETICLKCLEKDPERRYDSAANLAVDLEHWLRGETIHARPVTIFERSWKWTRRRPLQASFLFLLLASTVIIAGVVIVANRRVQDQQQVAVAATEARDLAAELAEKIRYMQGVAVVDRTLKSSGDVYSAEKRLQKLTPALRGWEWDALRMRTRADLRFLDDHAKKVVTDVTLLAGTPDVAAFRFDRTSDFTNSGELALWDSFQQRTVHSHSEVYRPVAISPAAHAFASYSSWENGSIVIRDLGTGQVMGTMPPISRVKSLTFSPNGQLLAACVGDGATRGAAIIWDLNTYKVLSQCEGDRTDFEHLAFSPDSRQLAASSPSSKELLLWDASTGRELVRFDEAGKIECLAFSPRGDLLASLDGDRIVLWDVASGSQRRVIKRDSQTAEDIFETSWGRDHARAIVFSADGNFLVSGGDTATERGTNEYADRHLGSLRIWNVDTGHQVLVLRGKIGAVRQLSFSPDGYQLAWSGFEDGITVLDFTKIRSTSILPGHGPIALAPDGRFVAWCDGQVHVYDTRTGQRIGRPMGDAIFGPIGVAYSNDGKRVAGGLIGGSWNTPIWDLATGKQVAILKGDSVPFGINFSPDDRLVLLATAMSVSVGDVSTGNIVFKSSPSNKAYCGAFSPDGRWLVTGGLQNSDNSSDIVIWDTSTWKPVSRLEGLAAGATGIAWSPDGKYIAACAGEPFDDSSTRHRDNPHEVLVWDAATGVLRLRLEGHSADVNTVLFTPDGRLVSASADRTVKIWDVDVGLEILTLGPATGPIVGLSVSKDGSVLAAGGAQYPRGPGAQVQNRIMMWFAPQLAPAPEGRRYPFLEVAPDRDVGQIVAGLNRPKFELKSASNNENQKHVRPLPDLSAFLAPTDERTVRLYDAGSGVVRHALNGLNDAVTAIAVNGKGTVAVVANGPIQRIQMHYDAATAKYSRTVSGKDGPGEVVVWDLATGQVRTTYRDHRQPVTSVAVSPDGATVVSSSAKEKVLCFWDSATGSKQNSIDGRFWNLTFAPDGTKLLVRRSTNPQDLSAGETVIIDMDSHRNVLVIPDPDGRFSSHQFSPDSGKLIRYGPKEAQSKLGSLGPSQVQLIDVVTGKVEQEFDEPNGWVGSVAWGPGPGQLTTASTSHYIRVWNIASGSLVRTHNYGSTVGLQPIWLSTDGGKLGIVADDNSGDVRVFDVARIPVLKH